jgi:hypothetical protein
LPGQGLGLGDFNDGAFDALKNPATRDRALARLAHGTPIAAPGRKAARTAAGGPGLVGESDPRPAVLHDARAVEPEHAFALARLADPAILDGTRIGALRDVDRPSYDECAKWIGLPPPARCRPAVRSTWCLLVFPVRAVQETPLWAAERPPVDDPAWSGLLAGQLWWRNSGVIAPG